jgi:hypothetical protein
LLEFGDVTVEITGDQFPQFADFGFEGGLLDDARVGAVKQALFEVLLQVEKIGAGENFGDGKRIQGIDEFASGKRLLGGIEQVEGGRAGDDDLPLAAEVVHQQFDGLTDGADFLSFVHEEDLGIAQHAAQVIQTFVGHGIAVEGVIAVDGFDSVTVAELFECHADEGVPSSNS